MFDIKKILSVAVLGLSMIVGTHATAVAETDITQLKGPGDVNVLLYYRAGGSYGRMSQQVIAPNLGDDFKEIKNIRGCAKMAEFVKNTDEKMFGLWDWFSTNEALEDGSSITEVSTPDSVEDNYRIIPGDSQSERTTDTSDGNTTTNN